MKKHVAASKAGISDPQSKNFVRILSREPQCNASTTLLSASSYCRSFSVQCCTKLHVDTTPSGQEAKMFWINLPLDINFKLITFDASLAKVVDAFH